MFDEISISVRIRITWCYNHLEMFGYIVWCDFAVEKTMKRKIFEFFLLIFHHTKSLQHFFLNFFISVKALKEFFHRFVVFLSDLMQ